MKFVGWGMRNLLTNEWIEIKNVSKEEIDLSGWQILNKNQKLKFVFEEGAKILPSEILLLKRGDDFSGAIKNSNEALFLFDKDCNLEDEVFATSSWPAGDNFSKRTAERKEDLSWQTSLDPGGTPGKENSSGFVEIEKEKEEKEPKISLSFPKEVFANQEFKVSLSVSDLESGTYDIKISILKISDESEQKRTISEISLTGEEWQSSYKYLPKVFSGASFSGDFKLRISQKYQDFKGEAEILAKVRQSSNRKVAAEFKDKIKIKEIEIAEKTPTEATPEETTSETQPLPETSSQVSFKILINEIQIAGQTVDDEFIELYNPNETPINLSGYVLKKKSNTGVESTLVTSSRFENKIIPAKGFLLLAREGYYQGSTLPDIFWPKSYWLASDNTVIFYDPSGKIVDKVGWGNAADFESQPFPQNPEKNQSLERINFQDTDNNAKDFQLQLTPSPSKFKNPIKVTLSHLRNCANPVLLLSNTGQISKSGII